MSPPRQLCSFRLDGHLFGIDVQDVQEVVRQITMTPVPLAARAVSGLLSLRGQIVAAIDLRRCFGMPDRDETQRPISLIVSTPAGPVSLLADEIGDVLEPDPKTFECSATTDESSQAQRLAGVYKLPHDLLRVLNVPMTIELVMSQRLENVGNDTTQLANKPPHSDADRR